MNRDMGFCLLSGLTKRRIKIAVVKKFLPLGVKGKKKGRASNCKKRFGGLSLMSKYNTFTFAVALPRNEKMRRLVEESLLETRSSFEKPEKRE
jgi:hypothetical protein